MPDVNAFDHRIDVDRSCGQQDENSKTTNPARLPPAHRLPASQCSRWLDVNERTNQQTNEPTNTTDRNTSWRS